MIGKNSETNTNKIHERGALDLEKFSNWSVKNDCMNF